MSGYVSARFDFAKRESVSKILVVASSYRSGSTYLSLSLWSDGRFGAPFEYFNYEKHMDYMMARLGTDEVDDYIQKLVRLRTSRNEVFGVKLHFHHFEAIVKSSPVWRDQLRIARFIYVNRKDKIAQAVSMAKALQDNAWSSFGRPRASPLFYSRELIEDCLREVMTQTEGWWRWFAAENIHPFVVNYEEFALDVPGHVARIAEWFGVEGDVREVVKLPITERQSDSVNREWIRRFLAESQLSTRSRSETRIKG